MRQFKPNPKKRKADSKAIYSYTMKRRIFHMVLNAYLGKPVHADIDNELEAAAVRSATRSFYAAIRQDVFEGMDKQEIAAVLIKQWGQHHKSVSTFHLFEDLIKGVKGQPVKPTPMSEDDVIELPCNAAILTFFYAIKRGASLPDTLDFKQLDPDNQKYALLVWKSYQKWLQSHKARSMGTDERRFELLYNQYQSVLRRKLHINPATFCQLLAPSKKSKGRKNKPVGAKPVKRCGGQPKTLSKVKQREAQRKAAQQRKAKQQQRKPAK
jgi:hypothetical protein